MASIRAIETKSVHHIQSGQVIVDLCSVVKELVENCLDAAATSIDVRFRNNGLDSIEVQDNGSGIRREDFDKIALKHYTSKLTKYDDIVTLNTFGFRGEALSSLCALSRFHIITAREDEAPRGTKLDFMPSGKLENSSISASPKGTTVTADDIFYNLPVRRQELRRNVKREYGKALNILHAYACISTGVRFTVSNQMPKGKKMIVFSTALNSHLGENIANVYGSKTMQALIPLHLKLRDNHPSSSMGSFNVNGFISRPIHGEGRQTPDRQMFFINSRPCTLPQVAKAFNEVYKSYNITQSPFVLANIRLDTNAYDVNVSPDKKTILLHDQAELLDNMKEKLTELFEGETISQTQMPVNDSNIKRHMTSTQPSGQHPSAQTTLVDHLVSHEPRTNSDATINLESPHSDDTALATSGNPSQNPGPYSQLPAYSYEHTKRDSLVTPRVGSNSLSNLRSGQGGVDTISRDYTQIHALLGGVVAATDSPLHHRSKPILDDDKNDPSSTSGMEPQDKENSTHSDGAEFNNSCLAPTASLERVDERCLNRGARAKTDALAKHRRVHIPNRYKFDDIVPDQSLPLLESLRSFALPSASLTPSPPVTETKTIPDNQTTFLPLQTQMPHVYGVSEVVREKSPSDDGSEADILDQIRKRRKDELQVREMIQRAEESFPKPLRNNSSLGIALSKNRPQKDSTQNMLFRLEISSLEIRKRLQKIQGLLRSDVSSKIWSRGMALATKEREKENTKESLTVEESLSLTVSKSDFSRMRVVGQFNLGFILAIRTPPATSSGLTTAQLPRRRRMSSDDLFIIDQHASDEIYNFHRLSETITLAPQPLVRPQALELTAVEEETIMSHNSTGGVLMKNGFRITVDTSGNRPVGKRCFLLTLPTSRETVFNVRDLEELLVSLGESSTSSTVRTLRPTKVRKMLAMRACRSSIMVGKHLTKKAMHTIVRHMGEIERPWNCPHGRPTMRHLACLEDWRKWKEADGFADKVESLSNE